MRMVSSQQIRRNAASRHRGDGMPVITLASGPVAQRQSTGLITPWSQVRILPGPLRECNSGPVPQGDMAL